MCSQHRRKLQTAFHWTAWSLGLLIHALSRFGTWKPGIGILLFFWVVFACKGHFGDAGVLWALPQCPLLPPCMSTGHGGEKLPDPPGFPVMAGCSCHLWRLLTTFFPVTLVVSPQSDSVRGQSGACPEGQPRVQPSHPLVGSQFLTLEPLLLTQISISCKQTPTDWQQ